MTASVSISEPRAIDKIKDDIKLIISRLAEDRRRVKSEYLDPYNFNQITDRICKDGVERDRLLDELWGALCWQNPDLLLDDQQ